jgi:hypothetical protein
MTQPEIGRLIGLARTLHARVVTIGHGRRAESRATATAFARAWQSDGGEILDVVDWPATAASWLRPARRLVAGGPDAWVVADTPQAWAQVARRLRRSTDWDPARTLGAASLDDARVIELAGAPAVQGMAGATADGGTWRVRGGLLVRDRADRRVCAR